MARTTAEGAAAVIGAEESTDSAGELSEPVDEGLIVDRLTILSTTPDASFS